MPWCSKLLSTIFKATETLGRGTQREYSLKSLKRSIVKRILVFKR